MSGDTTTLGSSTTTSSSRTGPPLKKAPEPRLARRAAWGLALGYTGLLLFLLWSPPTPSPPLFPHDDKVFHALAFTGIGASWWWVSHRPRFVWIFGLAMAVVTEVVQGMLPWPRSMDPLDMLADLVGVTLGLFVARRVRRPLR